MRLFVLGVNHRTAPLEIRGQLAFAPQQTQEVLQRLRTRFELDGFVLLSTCNRTELYGTLYSSDLSPQAALDCLLEQRNVMPQDLEGMLYTLESWDAAAHLFRVTAALDSMLLGEDQILGQVKTAYEASQAIEASNLELDNLFRRAITVAKQIKTETSLSQNSLSLGVLAARAAQQVLGDLEACRALVIGSGEMGMLALRNLAQAGMQVMHVTLRSGYDQCPWPLQNLIEELSHSAQITVVSYDEREKHLDQYDVIVSATQSPSYTLTQEAGAALAQDRPTVLLDLAVPRDLDPALGNLPHVHRFDLDQLQEIAEENLLFRRQEAQKAQVFVDAELEDFQRWWMHRQAMPGMRRVRANMLLKLQKDAQVIQRRSEKQNLEMDWEKAYPELASSWMETIFYRLREHASPAEMKVVYDCLQRAFRRW